MTSYKIAVIAGDGIGPDVVAQGLRVMDAVLRESDVTIEATPFDLGARRYLDTGEALPAADLARIREHDAILLGAVGDPSVPSGVLERGLLLKLRFELQQYVNLRPVKLYPGVASPLGQPGEIDFIVVREGTEGPYAGSGGTLRAGTRDEIATEVSVNTALGVERVVREAFRRASERPRRKLTLVHKTNVIVHAGGLWTRVVEEVGVDFPDVAVEYLHVDAATIFFVSNPSRFDVIVTDNLFGDILTDLAAVITGGMGLAASANINPDPTVPSMFEPIHGSAPDIAGRGIADPTATILSVGMMLAEFGLTNEAGRIERAVAADLVARGTAIRSTEAVGGAIAALVAAGD